RKVPTTLKHFAIWSKPSGAPPRGDFRSSGNRSAASADLGPDPVDLRHDMTVVPLAGRTVAGAGGGFEFARPLTEPARADRLGAPAQPVREGAQPGEIAGLHRLLEIVRGIRHRFLEPLEDLATRSAVVLDPGIEHRRVYGGLLLLHRLGLDR